MIRPPSSSTLHLSARAGRLCAIPLRLTVEIARPLPIEPVPGAPPFVLGVAVVRGEITPVVHLGALLREHAGEAGRFVIARAGERCVALAVSAVSGVRAIDGAALTAGRALAAEIAAPLIAAIVTEGAETITVIDVARVLDAPDRASAGAHG